MRSTIRVAYVLALAAFAPTPILLAQDNPTGDPVVQRIYDEGMHRSQARRLAQVLMDSIGPRLTGSPANRAANEWLLRTYKSWGIDAKNEQYGTWRDWTRGPSSLTLVAPRTRVFEATMHAWSAATPSAGITADVVIIPPAAELRDSAGYARWLAGVRGRLVLASMPQFTCRPDSDIRFWADSLVYRHAAAQRDSVTAEWTARFAAAHVNARAFTAELERAGAAAILTNSWSRGWGVDKIQSTRARTVPSFDVSCEDYSLLARLAEHGQHPRVHAVADAKLAAAESPVFNTIARIDGTMPNDYVMLSAHLDSWDSGSGATDNGTGTITMLEAMRILKAAYPHPKRTILAGHWSGEEEGEVGSKAFTEDHPDVIKGLQDVFNQDNGTGRIQSIGGGGMLHSPEHINMWLSKIPTEWSERYGTIGSGRPAGGGSDDYSFTCYGVPTSGLGALNWDYGSLTWHTERDTYDKVVFDDLRYNATLTAMLAYEASEDPTMIPHEKIDLAAAPQPAAFGGRGGGARTWPVCEKAPRKTQPRLK